MTAGETIAALGPLFDVPGMVNQTSPTDHNASGDLTGPTPPK
jgi:hypothetical protein